MSGADTVLAPSGAGRQPEPEPTAGSALPSFGARPDVRRSDLKWLGFTALAVVVGGLLPVLTNHRFYFWNDSEAFFLPDWYVIGERLRDGQFPLLNNNAWLAGNYAGETQLGIFNPVLLLLAVMVSLIPDLVVAATIVKVATLVLMGTGVYLLAREYGAKPAGSAAVAVALPLSGYALWWDGTSWAISLVGFASLPHVWWTLRRFARGRVHPVFPLIAGIFTITCGSPYGAVGAVVVMAAVAVERALLPDWRSLLRVAVVSLAIGLAGGITFLPLLGIAPVGFRSSGISNDMGMIPEIGQLLNLSSPEYLAPLRGWGAAMTTPVTYLAWFIVPLLPWFRFSALKGIRERAGILVWTAVYLLFVLGPAHLWLFRWPTRFIEYIFLPVCLAVALLLSAGLHRDKLIQRGLTSLALIGLGSYLAWSADPDVKRRHVYAVVIVAALVALVVFLARRRERLVTPALVVGTLAVLAVQLHWYPGNHTLYPWYFPQNVSQLRSDYADQAGGTTFAVASGNVPGWPDYLQANVTAAAGLQSLNGYTGMGNRKFSDELCLTYAGQVCPAAYDQVFTTDPATGVTLAELFRLRTIVVQRNYLPAGDPLVAPPGWEIIETTTHAITMRTTAPVTYPDGRLSWAAPSLKIVEDRSDGDRTERIRYSGGGTVVLAALAWPGWTAQVDGVDVPVTAGRAGLIELTLPDRGHETTVELRFVPDGLRSGIVLYVLALLIGGGYCAYHVVEQRRRRRESAPVGDPATAS
jgi:hypothetical protein